MNRGIFTLVGKQIHKGVWFIQILLLFGGIFTGSGFALETPSRDSADVILVKPQGLTKTGVLYQTAGSRLEKPLEVRVVRNGGEPVNGWPVHFSVISVPAGARDTRLEKTLVYSDSEGYARTYAVLGSKPGAYEFAARIYNKSGTDDIVFFKVVARKANWVFFLIIGLIGGLGLFLFGMGMMSEGMKKAAGRHLRSILSSLTNNRLVAVGVGTFVTMIIQSSSATTVMLVSFVQAQLMSFAQSLGIILGADIGTTITAQLIAFKLTDYALLMIGVGFGMIFLSKVEKYKNIGEAVLGFGMLFFGMHVMSEAMHPLRTYTPFLDMLLELENPLFGILVGAAFTALIQSSSAFTGIIIILASQGLLTLEAGIPLLLGANIGTCVTAVLASINTGREAKRVALAHTLFKVFGVLLFFWWIPHYADIIRWVSPKGNPELTGIAHLADVVPRQIANAHTIFNVALTALVLPFTNQAANFIQRLLPDVEEKEEEVPYHTRYLDENLISTPTLALNLAKVEVLRMGSKVREMVQQIIRPFLSDEEAVLDKIEEQEEEVDYLRTKINDYLTKISQQSLPEERIDEVFQMMHTVTELEQMADIVSKNLRDLALKRIRSQCSFSEAGKSELIDYHTRTMKQISRALEVFKDVNLEKAQKMEEKYRKYRLMEMSLRRTHFDRLRRDIPETVATSEIHLELMDLLKRISSHATNIARILLEWGGEREKVS